MKEIIITPHAIQRYKERSYTSETLPDEQINKTLSLIARKGSVTRRCPGGSYEMTYNGDAIVAIIKEPQIKVLTFLGNKQYRQWFQKKEIKPRYARAL